MKKLLFILLIAIAFVGYSQQKHYPETEFEGSPKSSLYRKNELRLNTIFLLFKGMELGYERILNDDVSLGISSLLFVYDSEVDALNFHVSPYTRYYFGKNPSSGFFIEGFTSIFNKTYMKNNEVKKRTSGALGLSIGNKWVKRSGLSLELSFGVGREPRSIHSSDESPFIPKGEFSIGYRF